MPDSPVPAGPDRFQGPDGTLAFHTNDHIIVLILIYIKYTKKCGFDNCAAMLNKSSHGGWWISTGTSYNPLNISS